MHFGLETRFPFGKYKGERLVDVAFDDPGYIDWLVQQTPHTVDIGVWEYAMGSDTWSPDDEPDMSTPAGRRHYYEWALSNETEPDYGPDWGIGVP